MSESIELSAALPAADTPRSMPTVADPGALLGEAIGLVAGDLALVEAELAVLLHSSVAVIPEVGGHLAFAGGKRFRPLLTLLCARAAELDDVARITVAAVGELLHTATLLHDDVIDAGEFRRGRPTARMRFGNGMAVLTGDFCLARALGAIARTGRLAAVTTMSDAVTRMAEGEVAQLHACGDDSLDRARYALVIDRKTAALIEWCASVAGLPEPPVAEVLGRYGRELGFAFQIADDVLDYGISTAGGPAATGKDPGQDLRDGKMTLPLIYACEADPRLHARVRALLRRGPPLDPALADELCTEVVRTGAAARAALVAEQHAERACTALAALPASRARAALEMVARYVVRRSA